LNELLGLVDSRRGILRRAFFLGSQTSNTAGESKSLNAPRSRFEGDQKGRYWSERTYGSFELTIPLAIDVDGEEAKSEFKNRVLRIELPKREGAKPRAHKIDVSGFERQRQHGRCRGAT
jgi:hypothetical protein